MKRGTINIVMAFLSIGVLLLPIGISEYVEAETITNIIEVQGNYKDGDYLEIYSGPLNTSELTAFGDLNPQVEYGYEDNNDTLFLGTTYELPGHSRIHSYYGDYTTYIGNNNYTTIIDTDPLGPYIYSFYYTVVPLALNNSDALNYDFFRFYINEEYSDYSWLAAYADGDFQNLHKTSLGAFDIYVLTEFFRNEMTLNPDYQLCMVIASVNPFEPIDAEWSIQAFSLEPQDMVFGSEYTDTTIWVGTMMGLISIYMVAVIFATPWIDIKTDW